jgi:hypothetical protein
MAIQYQVVALLAVSTLAFGQARIYDFSSSIIDSYEKGVRLRIMREMLELERRKFEMERQLQEEQLRQIQTQTDRIRRENELRQSTTPTSVRTTEGAGQIEGELQRALFALVRRYDDFEDYIEPISRLTELFQLSPNKGLTVESYLESLYVVAKYASFAKDLQVAATQTTADVPGTRMSRAESRPVVPAAPSSGSGPRTLTVTCPASWVFRSVQLRESADGNPGAESVLCGSRVSLLAEPSGDKAAPTSYRLIRTENGLIGYLHSSWLR